MCVDVLAYDTRHPGDTDDLIEKLSRFAPDRIRRLALLAKTEGNADVNDFSREFALLSADLALRAYGGDQLIERATFLVSTGCEGAMTPFGYLFVDHQDHSGPPRFSRALAIGSARSRSLAPSEIGRMAHLALTGATLQSAIDDAGVSKDEIALAVIKTPVRSSIGRSAAEPVIEITSARAKAVAALGAGVALGEIDCSTIAEDSIGCDHSLYCRRAMAFSGTERDCIEVLVLANKAGAAGDLQIHTGLLGDLLDGAAIRKTLVGAGCGAPDGNIDHPERLVASLLKVGVAADGRLRGLRTTIKNSHIDMDKHVRAAASGVLGSIIGSTRNFISADTIHQAPDGGGLFACITRQA